MKITSLLTFKQAAASIRLDSPRVLSDAFYLGILGDEHCAYIGTRRFIPTDKLRSVATTLARAGRKVGFGWKVETPPSADKRGQHGAETDADGSA